MRASRFLIGALGAALTAACVASAETDAADERFPVSSSYPPGTMERVAFTAPLEEGWRLSALQTPERPEASWRVVVITGTPSWSEYWAPTIAGMPETREMIVADRPGFSQSEPQGPVRDLMKQVEALSPMLDTREGERVLLVGQSFGAPLAALMAARYPDKVDAVLMVSAYFGDRGPTARRMFGVGRVVQPLLPRDLRNSISEVSAQRSQLPAAFDALMSLEQPVVFIHGDRDTFVPLEADRRIAAQNGDRLVEVAGGDHFLNACCVPALIEAMELAIAEAEARQAGGAQTEAALAAH